MPLLLMRPGNNDSAARNLVRLEISMLNRLRRSPGATTASVRPAAATMR